MNRNRNRNRSRSRQSHGHRHRHGRRSLIVLAILLATSPTVTAAALDDIKLEVSQEPCEGVGVKKSVAVYASNLNSTQTIDANFKYDTNPAKQHFILFDADLNPITDRFPKFQVRRLSPGESAKVGCTATYRAAPQPPGPLSIPIVTTKQGAAYVGAAAATTAADAAAESARSFAAFLLQGGIGTCPSGAKPPGMFYLVNLHPYARLSASLNLLDEHGGRVGEMTPNLSPLSAARLGCSNGSSSSGPILSATLEEPVRAAASVPPAAPPAAALLVAPAPAALAPEAPPRVREPGAPQPIEAPLAPLSLGAILRTQNVCAGSVTSGWIKINDAWNPTVCGKPASIAYNVWTLQQLSDQPVGAVVQACKGPVPSGWTLVGTAWNPTVCGHPATNQSNVMAIKRLE